ncbi:MAG: heme A synthase [Planctomycetota bacterium]
MAVMTLVMAFTTVVFGACVKSFEAGMAFPDWPTSNGYFLYFLPISQRTGAQFWEHTHRELGSLVGLFMLATTLLVMKGESRPLVRRLSLCALAIVCAQGYLGGSTVLNELKIKAISINHACIAQALTGLVLILCVLTSKSWISHVAGARIPFRRIYSVMPVLILVQLLFGAIYRHTLSMHALISHIVFAFVVVGIIIWGALMVLRDFKGQSNITKPAVVMCLLSITQIGLGAAAYMMRMATETSETIPVSRAMTASAHVFMGLLMLCGSIVLYLQARRADNPSFGT